MGGKKTSKYRRGITEKLYGRLSFCSTYRRRSCGYATKLNYIKKVRGRQRLRVVRRSIFIIRTYGVHARVCIFGAVLYPIKTLSDFNIRGTCVRVIFVRRRNFYVIRNTVVVGIFRRDISKFDGFHGQIEVSGTDGGGDGPKTSDTFYTDNPMKKLTSENQ